MGKGNDPNCSTLAAAMTADPGADRMAAAQAKRELLLEGIRAMNLPAVYEVGGCVRDELLGRPPKDIDLMVCGMTYEELLDACQKAGKATPLENVSTGQLIGVRLRAPFTSGEDIEVALARTEISTGAGHGDFEITALPVPEHLADIPVSDRAGDPALAEQVLVDLARRDVTVNAIARDIATGEMIDPYDGAADVAEGRLRAVSADTFRDDPLRCFRLLARMAKDDSAPDPDTEQMVRDWARKLRIQDLPDPEGSDPAGDPLPQDRVREELKKILGWSEDPEDGAKHSAHALTKARDWGLLGRMIPAWEDCIGFDQQSKYHSLTVDEHILRTVAHGDRIGADPVVKAALLFHDMGKPGTAKLGADGHLHFHEATKEDAYFQQAADRANQLRAEGGLADVKLEGEQFTAADVRRIALAPKCQYPQVRALLDDRAVSHEQLAAEQLRDILGPGSGLRFDKPTAENIRYLVSHHMFSEERDFADRPSKKREVLARRFLAQHGHERARQLCQVRRCDLGGKGTEVSPDSFRHIDAFEAELRAQAHQPVSLKALAIDGRALGELGLPPGPKHGQILKELLGAVVADPSRNDAEWLRGQAAKQVLQATGGTAEKAREVLQAAKDAREARKAAAREAYLASGGTIPG